MVKRVSTTEESESAPGSMRDYRDQVVQTLNMISSLHERRSALAKEHAALGDQIRKLEGRSEILQEMGRRVYGQAWDAVAVPEMKKMVSQFSKIVEGAG